MIEVLAMFAVWRLCSLLVREAGPGDMFAKIRALVGVTYDQWSRCTGQRLAGAFCCVWCMSVWVAAAAAIAVGIYRSDPPFIVALDWLAFSTGAILIDKVAHNGK